MIVPLSSVHSNDIALSCAVPYFADDALLITAHSHMIHSSLNSSIIVCIVLLTSWVLLLTLAKRTVGQL